MEDKCVLITQNNKYHNYECCEWTRGIDKLLNRYREDRSEVVSMMLNDPNKLINTIWASTGPLAVDNECRCQMGNGEIRTPFSCAQCKNLRRLMDFRLGGIEKPFTIQCGDSAGQNLVVTAMDITNPFLKWDPQAEQQAKLYVKQYNSLRSCGTPDITNLKCITGDSFTIRTLIMWMLYNIFKKKGLEQHIPKLYTAFVCRGIGYSLYNLPSIGTIDSLEELEHLYVNENLLKSCVARSILLQLMVILLESSKVNFSLGTPSIDSIIFNKEPVSYMYDGVHIDGEITMQLTNMWNASATFNDIHYFPANIKSRIQLDRGIFVPDISTKIVSMAHCHDVGGINPNNDIVCPSTLNICPDLTTYDVCKPHNATLYRLTMSTVDIFNAMKHIGFPLYVGSFDFYCLFVGLMCNKAFYNSVVNDNKLYRLWSMIWLIDDISTIENRIKEYHDIGLNEKQTVINIIRGSWLRCDVVTYLWSLIKLGW